VSFDRGFGHEIVTKKSVLAHAFQMPEDLGLA